MGRIAYVNGRFVPHSEAVVHIEDRGYQLADLDAVEPVRIAFGAFAPRGGSLAHDDRRDTKRAMVEV